MKQKDPGTHLSLACLFFLGQASFRNNYEEGEKINIKTLWQITAV